jgi:hypothetical protein
MIQPFWALPLLGLAGLSARDVMGYTTMVLIWSGLIMSVFALPSAFASSERKRAESSQKIQPFFLIVGKGGRPGT